VAVDTLDVDGNPYNQWIFTMFKSEFTVDKTDAAVTNNIGLTAYVRFEGLEFDGPHNYDNVIQPQMGDNVNALTAAAIAMGTTVAGMVGAGLYKETYALVDDKVKSVTKTVVNEVYESVSGIRNNDESRAEEDVSPSTAQHGVASSTHGSISYATRREAGSCLTIFPDRRLVNPARYGDKSARHSVRGMCKIPPHLLWFSR
jgi:hypothetical protein